MTSFDESFCRLFDERFASLFRYLDRRTGDACLASDLAQEAFTRLYSRGKMPDDPGAWLVTVALNLLRNDRSRESRRRELLSVHSADAVLADSPAGADRATERNEERERVRVALDRLEPRERDLLLLREEGYSYREMAAILKLAEASVGTMLRRARDAFRQSFQERVHASDG